MKLTKRHILKARINSTAEAQNWRCQMKWKKRQAILLCAIGLFVFGATAASTVHAADREESTEVEPNSAAQPVDLAVA